MKNTFVPRHETIGLESSFENFTTSLEKTAGRFDYAILDQIGDYPERAQLEIRQRRHQKDRSSAGPKIQGTNRAGRLCR